MRARGDPARASPTAPAHDRAGRGVEAKTESLCASRSFRGRVPIAPEGRRVYTRGGQELAAYLCVEPTSLIKGDPAAENSVTPRARRPIRKLAPTVVARQRALMSHRLGQFA